MESIFFAIFMHDRVSRAECIIAFPIDGLKCGKAALGAWIVFSAGFALQRAARKRPIPGLPKNRSTWRQGPVASHSLGRSTSRFSLPSCGSTAELHSFSFPTSLALFLLRLLPHRPCHPTISSFFLNLSHLFLFSPNLQNGRHNHEDAQEAGRAMRW